MTTVRVRWNMKPTPAQTGWNYRDFESDGDQAIPTSTEAEQFAEKMASLGVKQIMVDHSQSWLLPTTSEPKKCAVCGAEILILLDDKYGGPRAFERRPTKDGRWIDHPGKAVWWGSTGGRIDLHTCPSVENYSRPDPTPDNVLGTVEDVPDWYELGYATPTPRGAER